MCAEPDTMDARAAGGEMTRPIPSQRRMFDTLNACPWNTRELRTDHLAETLIARGMTRAEADALAAETYAAWDAATRSYLGG